jgi:hypothetical protein
MVPPFQVPPVMTVDARYKALVPQVTFSGMYAWTSHVPATVPFESNAISAAPPELIVPTAPSALSIIVSVPVALLLNWKTAVLVSVVASGSLNVCPPVPLRIWL